MRVRIHRGCHEIGGNCVEIESHGQRIVLDIGLPLSDASPVDLPEISGLTEPDNRLRGIIISHPHPDHYGLLERVTQNVPIYIGAAANRIIGVSSFFTRLPGLGNRPTRPLVDGQTIQIGPFFVTPYRIDHSAFDSYCLLVEAGGKRLFYTGDVRGHGYNVARFNELVARPPQDVDVLICEGTQVGREPDFAFPDEDAVSLAMTEVINQTRGMVMVWCSGQNLDRLAAIWRSVRETGRQLIVDMYTAEIIRAAQHPGLPRIESGELKIYLPASQKRKIKSEGAFHISDPYAPYRIYPEHLATAAQRSVMICRPSMLPEMRAAGCFIDAAFVSSLWMDYVQQSERQLRILSDHP
jgi:ribonuclease J